LPNTLRHSFHGLLFLLSPLTVPVRGLLSSAVLPHLFFFYSYCHHRALHSFPTRRSSDLLVGIAFILRLILKMVLSKMQNLMEKVDRKSTRLNSSHVSISYAVFCLKKKKQVCVYTLSSENSPAPP